MHESSQHVAELLRPKKVVVIFRWEKNFVRTSLLARKHRAGGKEVRTLGPLDVDGVIVLLV